MNQKVAEIQAILGVSADGVFGPKSKAALDALIAAPVATGAVDERSEANIATLDAIVQPMARDFIRALISNGMDARIIDGSRTFAQQDALYEQGRTKPGPIVTYARGGQSWHCFGVAFDIGLFENGKYLEESSLYESAMVIGESRGFECGGRWLGAKQDLPHYQWNPNKLSLAEARLRHAAGRSILA